MAAIYHNFAANQNEFESQDLIANYDDLIDEYKQLNEKYVQIDKSVRKLLIRYKTSALVGFEVFLISALAMTLLIDSMTVWTKMLYSLNEFQ